MIRLPPRSTLFPYTRSSDLVLVLVLVLVLGFSGHFEDEDEPRLFEEPTNQNQCEQSLGSRSEEHTSELQSHVNLVCRLLLEKKKRACRRSGRLMTKAMSQPD